MLHKETVSPQTLDLIHKLTNDPNLRDFLLVGGTSLALQIGHRISVDIDLFTPIPFNTIQLSNHLKSNYNVNNLRTLKNGIFCFIDDIKVDLIRHRYPQIYPPVNEGGIKMASLKEIGAMKINAIVNDGSRIKDFADIYFLLEKIPLQDLVLAYERKYYPQASRSIAYNALLYHKDLRQAPINYINKQIKLIDITDRLKRSVLNPNKVHSHVKPEKTMRRKGRGRGL